MKQDQSQTRSVALKYLQPEDLASAIAFTQELKEPFRFIAGGTDIMPRTFDGIEAESHLIDLSEIDELEGIWFDGDRLRIGPLTKLEDIQQAPEILSHFPMLVEAAHSVGSPLIRKMGTIGGNLLCENRCLYYNQSEFWRDAIGHCLKCKGEICIASGGTKACFSEFVSDTAPALIAMNAELEILNEAGLRSCKLEEIYTSEGVAPRNLEPGDILTAILLPISKQLDCRFHKLRQRESLEFTALTTAIAIDEEDNLKLALAGVSPGPVIVEGRRSDTAESLIRAAMKQARSVENNMLGRKYRKEMMNVILGRLLAELGVK